MATYMTKDRLGQTITKGQDNEGNPSVQIAGNLSPEEYQMQRYLGERADQERYASLNTPTYSGDPNRIAEGNALAEMQRTGLNQYYHPNSAAYYAAFQGIRDKYLQQEMSKKASIENEGKQLYSNRMGAFDKLIQDQYGIQKEKIESAGLEGMRKAQQKLYEIQAEGDGMTPAQRLADKRAQINSIQAQADDARAIIVAQLKEETDPQMRKMLNDGLGKIPGHVRAATEAIRRGNDYTGLQEFNTWLANPRGYRAAAPAKVPVAQGSGSSGLVKKYNSPEEVMAALKNTDASTAVQILRANNMTVDDLRKTGQPKTPSPKAQEAAKQKRPHEMTPEELKKADVEYWNKWKTAAGRVSPIAPKSPSEQAAEFNKAVEYNRQLAERAKKRNLFGQR